MINNGQLKKFSNVSSSDNIQNNWKVINFKCVLHNSPSPC
jgi:hypothetical protein